MPSDPRPGDRHKHDPIAYRPPAGVREPLMALAERRGCKASAVITEILREYFAVGSGEACADDTATVTAGQ